MPTMTFQQYHATNPHIYELIRKYTREARNAGFQHYSMRAIMQRIRWHINITTRDLDGFKINHNFSRNYSIKLMDENPSYTGFFRIAKR